MPTFEHPNRNTKPDLLSGMLVYEVGDALAVRYAGRLLCDLGAQVIIERSQECEVQAVGFSTYLDRGKTIGARDRIAADLRNAADSAPVVLFDTGDPWARSQAEKIQSDFRLAHRAQVSDYGSAWVGRRPRASELTLQAECGLMLSHDTLGREPIATGTPMVELTAGVCLAIGAVQCLLEAEADLEPASADVSRFESGLALVPQPWLNGQIEGHVPYPVPMRSVPGIERTSDGWICMAVASPDQWRAVVDLVGDPVLTSLSDADYYARIKLQDEIRPIIAAFTSVHTTEDLVRLGVERRIPITPVNQGFEVLDAPPYSERGVFALTGEGHTEPLSPIRVTSDGDRGGAPSRKGIPVPGQPLRGIRVLEFCSFQAGPQVGAYLAALGADVVKVESPRRPDLLRYAGVADPSAPGAGERGGMFNYLNLNKRAITLDLDDHPGLETMRRLIARSDVVLDSFLPRVLDRLGLDGEGVRAIKPDVVFLRMPAWGLDGSWANRAGYTFSVNAICGLASLTGHPDGPPTLSGSALDPFASFLSTLGLLAALHARENDGQGRQLEVALGDAGAHAVGQAITAATAAGGAWPGLRGNIGSCDESNLVLRAQGGVAWVALTAPPSKLLELCEALSQHEMASLGATAPTDLSSAAEQLAGLADLCAATVVVEAARRLDISAAVVTSGEDAVGRPEVKGRGRVIEVDRAITGVFRAIGFPIAMNPSSTLKVRPAPMFGEHNEEVLAELHDGSMPVVNS